MKRGYWMQKKSKELTKLEKEVFTILVENQGIPLKKCQVVYLHWKTFVSNGGDFQKDFFDGRVKFSSVERAISKVRECYPELYPRFNKAHKEYKDHYSSPHNPAQAGFLL